MAVLPRVTRIRLQDNATGITNVLEWVATAAVQDTPAGASVVVTIVRTVAGVPPGDPTSLSIRPYLDTGVALVPGTVLNATAASQTFTFHFTSDATATGAARAGTIEFIMRATRSDPVTYDVRSDANPNTPPTGFTSVLDRGWVRGTTTATQVISNVSFAGPKVTPAEYDESLFVRTTLGAALYVARSLTVGITAASPALTAATNSSTSGNFEATFTTVVDDRFPAAVTAASTTLTIPNSTLTGQPAFVATSTAADSIDVDPRLTASHHFQVDDSAFGLSKHDASKSMLSTQSGFLATRFVTARTAAGTNGLTVTQTLTPAAAGTAVSGSSSTATRDGQPGWTDLLAWVSSKPGGNWNKTLDITAPGDIDADTHVVGGTDTYVLLAPDPRIVPEGYVNKLDTQRGHFTAGDPIVVSMVVLDSSTWIRIDPARVTEPTVSIKRFVSDTRRYEYLRADGVWVLWEPDQPAPALAMTASASDPRSYEKEFLDTTDWIRDLTSVSFRVKVDGTPYPAAVFREETGNLNEHSTYALDPVALALSGVLSFR